MIERLAMAEELLGEAEYCLSGGKLRAAVSRAYYSSHHAARACLEKVGRPPTGDVHDGTISLFGLWLVATGVFAAWMGRWLNHGRDLRSKADYEPTFVVIPTMAQEAVQNARNFLSEVKAKWSVL